MTCLVFMFIIKFSTVESRDVFLIFTQCTRFRYWVSAHVLCLFPLIVTGIHRTTFDLFKKCGTTINHDSNDFMMTDICFDIFLLTLLHQSASPFSKTPFSEFIFRLKVNMEHLHTNTNKEVHDQVRIGRRQIYRVVEK